MLKKLIKDINMEENYNSDVRINRMADRLSENIEKTEFISKIDNIITTELKLLLEKLTNMEELCQNCRQTLRELTVKYETRTD